MSTSRNVNDCSGENRKTFFFFFYFSSCSLRAAASFDRYANTVCFEKKTISSQPAATDRSIHFERVHGKRLRREKTPSRRRNVQFFYAGTTRKPQTTVIEEVVYNPYEKLRVFPLLDFHPFLAFLLSLSFT